MDQLRAMRTFAEVARRGGFAAAARALDTAPSVVTRLVAELELQLGARLLNRTTRRVALTSVGQRYLERVEGILRDLDDTAAWVAQGQKELRGRVRLMAPPLFAARELVPRLQHLQALHPGIAVDLLVDHQGPHALQRRGYGADARRTSMTGQLIAAARLLARERLQLSGATARNRPVAAVRGSPNQPVSHAKDHRDWRP